MHTLQKLLNILNLQIYIFNELFPDEFSFTESGPLIGGSVAAFLLLVSLVAICFITLGKRKWKKTQKTGTGPFINDVNYLNGAFHSTEMLGWNVIG